MNPPPEHAVLSRLPDEELVARAVDGQRAALDVLLRRHGEMVYKVCRRMCDNESDALDATQEALLLLARRIDRFDGRSAFTTWLYRVATNACYDELRRKRRRPVPVDRSPADDTLEIEDDAAGSDHATQVADRMSLDDALAQLAPEFRAPIVLRDVGGHDYAAIAETLGIPSGTVRSRIARGRAQLAKLLDAGNQEATPDRLTMQQPALRPPQTRGDDTP